MATGMQSVLCQIIVPNCVTGHSSRATWHWHPLYPKTVISGFWCIRQLSDLVAHFSHPHHPVPRETGLGVDCVYHCGDWTHGSFSSTENSFAAMNISISSNPVSLADLWRGPTSFKMCRSWTSTLHVRKAPECSHLQMASALEEDLSRSKRGETKTHCKHFA